jgi:hypothetical protein
MDILRGSPHILLSLDGQEEVLTSRITQALPGEALYIEAPLRRGEAVDVAHRTEISFEIPGSDSGLRYRSHVLEETRGGYRLAWPYNAPRVERRRHPRLAVGLPASARWSEGDAEHGAAAWTANLSEGGVLLYLTEPVPVGTAFCFLLHVPGLRPVEIEATVLRSGAVEEGEEWDFWAAAEFIAPKQHALEAIRSLFEKPCGRPD